ITRSTERKEDPGGPYQHCDDHYDQCDLRSPQHDCLPYLKLISRDRKSSFVSTARAVSRADSWAARFAAIPQRQVATADSSLKSSRLMKTDQRECKCRKRAVRRESCTWSSVGF